MQNSLLRQHNTTNQNNYKYYANVVYMSIDHKRTNLNIRVTPKYICTSIYKESLCSVVSFLLFPRGKNIKRCYVPEQCDN